MVLAFTTGAKLELTWAKQIAKILPDWGLAHPMMAGTSGFWENFRFLE